MLSLQARKEVCKLFESLLLSRRDSPAVAVLVVEYLGGTPEIMDDLFRG